MQQVQPTRQKVHKNTGNLFDFIGDSFEREKIDMNPERKTFMIRGSMLANKEKVVRCNHRTHLSFSTLPPVVVVDELPPDAQPSVGLTAFPVEGDPLAPRGQCSEKKSAKGIIHFSLEMCMCG